MKKIVNGIEIELTSKEIAQRQLDEQQSEQEILAYKQKISQEKAKKESAIAKLKALGLTEEEIKSIL